MTTDLTTNKSIPTVNRSILNFNVGVLGHVDSGKTSLVKTLSTTQSTACFDKNPQSRERGITLDLGFSSFSVESPAHLKEKFDNLQFTLVDCPGHASLIRTIIGGAQIVDAILLVIDVTKGIQTQTAECLVIGQIVCTGHMIIVLNKIDLLPQDKRKSSIEKMTKRLEKTLETTKFIGSPIISLSAKPANQDSEPIGMQELIDALKKLSYLPKRDASGSFLFSVDHCFLIKGQGTVMTGTVLNGTISLNQTIEIPALKVSKKVKSIQMFKIPVNSAIQGDRIGVCVTQFDAKLLERGLVCQPGSLIMTNRILTMVDKISYFKMSVKSKSKFHISLGHETMMAKCLFFARFKNSTTSKENTLNDIDDKINRITLDNKLNNDELNVEIQKFNFNEQYAYLEELYSLNDPIQKKDGISDKKDGKSDTDNSFNREDILEQFAFIELESGVNCGQDFLVIGSKLDTDIHSNSCRLAFHGKICHIFAFNEIIPSSLKIYKNKRREGVVERKIDEQTLVCKGIFKKETNFDIFINLKVTLSTGEHGYIEGGFGQSGKVKVRIPDGISKKCSEILNKLSNTGRKKSNKNKNETNNIPDNSGLSQDKTETENVEGGSGPIKLLLHFKKYLFNTDKKIIQK